jgi:DNA-directed RNA polymerase specialized sigma24 family protein
MSNDPEDALRRAYRHAVLTLPGATRDIFLAHRVDDDDLAVIAAHRGLSVEEVARHLADALIAIDRALRLAGR